MNTEDKELLFKDLCARLPYGVKCVFHSKMGEIPATITKFDAEVEMFSYKPVGSTITYLIYIDEIKPYLRPMSSMTDEEREKFRYGFGSDLYGNIKRIDWLNKNHFDYRELIPMGLALKAPKKMYK